MGEEVERLAEVEQLAAVLSGASAEYVHLAAPAHMEQARDLLASPWLAARDAEVAERVLREVGEALKAESIDAHNPHRQRGRDLWGLSIARRVVDAHLARAGAAGDGEEGAARPNQPAGGDSRGQVEGNATDVVSGRENGGNGENA